MGKKYIMSPNQKRLFALEYAQNVKTAYNMPLLIKIEADIDISRFEKAIKRLIQQHEVFRTHFSIKGEIFIQEVEEDVDITVEKIYIQDEMEAKQCFSDFIQPFELTKAPLLRVQLMEAKNKDTYLCLDMHHIITDGESAGIIWNDLVTFYKGNSLKPLEYQYKDYSSWIDEYDFSEHAAYWANEFSGEVPVLNLHTDCQRSITRDFIGDVVYSKIDREAMIGVRQLAKEMETTEFIVLLSFFSILLSKYARQEEFVIGMPVSGRTMQELKYIVGMFVNTIAVKLAIKTDWNLKEVIHHIKEKCYKAYQYQDYPFDKLVDGLRVEKDNSRNPIFDVMFAQENNGNKLLWGDSTAKIMENDIINSKFDLSVTVSGENDEYNVGWEYSISLFNRETIERMANHFINLILDGAQNPEKIIKDLSVLDDMETNLVVHEFNNTYTDYPSNKTIIEMFEEQVEKTYSKIAVQLGEEGLTYKELNERANYIGKLLRDKGIGENSIVGIICERSIEMIVAIFGILKSGAAYMPIDPGHPVDRVNFMISESKARVVLAGAGSKRLAELIEGCETISLIDYHSFVHDNLPIIATSESMAYIIFTSGSTGTPKGVMVKNKNVVNLSLWHISNIKINSNSTVIQNYNYIFDASVSEIFPTALAGAKLILIPEERKNDPSILLDYLPNSQLSVVPSMFRLILEYAYTHQRLDVFDKFDKIDIGAEAFSIELLRRYQELTGNTLDRLYNMYGPTETTDVAVSYKFSGNHELDIVPIGKPISNTRVYILDGTNLCGIGIPGELCIAGEGMSLGYLNRPELNKEKFIQNPIVANEIIYRTGDLGRWMEDGNIEYIGRIDEQVKIRGFRVELGEIESRIREIEGIIDVIVIAQFVHGDKSLCAYIISNDDLDYGMIRTILAEHLPEYMIPLYFTQVEEFPKTNSGKINRKALPVPEGNSITTAYEEPVSPEEKLLSDIIKDILNVDRFGLNDRFIEMGGDSIKAIRVMSKARECNYEINVKNIMKYRTLREIAKSLMIKTGDTDEKVLIVDNMNKQNSILTTNLHEQINKIIYKKAAINKNTVIKEYEVSDIQRLLLGLPYSIIQDQIKVRGLTIEQIKESIHNFCARQEATRTSYYNNGNSYIMQVHEYSEDIEIEVIDMSCCNEGEYNRIYDEIYNLEVIKNCFGENLKLFKIIVTKEDEMTSMIHITAHHSVWDKKSTQIMESYMEAPYGNEIQSYVGYAELSNRKIEWERDDFQCKINDFLRVIKNYYVRNQNKKLVSSEYCKFIFDSRQNELFEKNTWDVIHCMVKSVLVVNGLLPIHEEEYPYLVTQEDRGDFGSDYVNTAGVFIDFLPIIVCGYGGTEDVLKEIRSYKVEREIKYLGFLQERVGLEDTLLSMNFIGDFTNDMGSLGKPMDESRKDAVSEIAIYRCGDTLFMRYPVFNSVQANYVRRIDEIINQLLNLIS